MAKRSLTLGAGALFAVLTGVVALCCWLLPMSRSDAVSPMPSQRGTDAMPVPPERRLRFHMPRVGDVTVYTPRGTLRGVVLFFSGDAGWNAGVGTIAEALASRGLAVAGVSTPAFLQALEAARGGCINVSFDLVALSQQVQHHLGLPGYQAPALLGHAAGATLAYVALAQGAPGLWPGAVSIGFRPELPGRKPWCAVGALAVTRGGHPAPAWTLQARPLPGPWIVLQGERDQAVGAAVRAFVDKVPQGRIVSLPKLGDVHAAPATGLGAIEAAVESVAKGPVPQAPPAALPQDFPVRVHAPPKGAPADPRLAIIFSGDGGWVGFDRSLANRLAERGIPVLGIDSLGYFWRPRSPRSTALDLARLIAAARMAFGRNQVLLVGYSFGADILPATVRALPAETRRFVTEVALLGPSGTGNFQFHLTDWLNVDRSGYPIAPDIRGLRPLPVRCIQGEQDLESACKALGDLVRTSRVPGGHHFNGDAAAVANAILGRESPA